MTAVILAIGIGLSTLLIGNIRFLRGIDDSVVALNVADTGIEAILYEERLGGVSAIDDCDGTGPQPGFCSGTLTLSDGTTASYSVIVETGGGCTTYCAESTGEYQGTTRRAEIER